MSRKGGGVAQWLARRRGPNDAVIKIKVALDHPREGKSFSGGGAAIILGKLCRWRNGFGHFPFVPHQKPCFAGFDAFRQSARWKRDDWGSAGERLHGDQRTCFGRGARDQQTARPG